MKNILLLSLTLLIGACGAASTSDSSNPAQSASQSNGTIVLTDLAPEQIEDVVAAYNAEGKAVLLNVWATWCGPCVEEFPDIVELKHKYNDQLAVLFISADFPEDRERAIEFLREQKVDWETYLKVGKDEPFINALSADWGGALPFTKIYNKNGEIVTFWENKASYETFEKAILEALNTELN
jgi:thiol-disulfide isomerase/thioredoxin